ncbi:MAG: hypothetical protein QOE61_536, partial [Micromonosporaceae bacterium]|nr:hypothetical protein [Micromonosporaceae bacterium]
MHHRAREVLRYRQGRASTQRPATEPEPLENVGADGGDNSVVGCAVGVAERSVAEDHSHVGEARSGEPRSGTVHSIFVHVDRRHLPTFTDQMREEAGVVS